MVLRKINKVLFITLLVLSYAILNCYPQTGAKYIEKKDGRANYSVNIKNMYIGKVNENLTESGSTYETLNMNFTINRSDLYKTTDTKDIYSFEVNSGCSIKSVTAKNIKNVSISSNTASAEFTNVSIDPITVKYSCVVDSIKNSDNIINTAINVYEKIIPEQTKRHLYATASFGMSEEAYYAKYPIMSEVSNTYEILSSASNKYKDFTAWINAYTANFINSDDQALFKEYIYNVFNDESSILDSSNYSSLKGFTITYDSVNNKYIYLIDNSCLGYAKTYSVMKDKSIVSQDAYYYISDKSNLKNVFFDYLTMYKTKTGYTDEDINYIKQYINDNSGDFSKITGVTINGLSPYTQIITSNRLLSAATSNANDYIAIEFGSRSDMSNTFISLINEKYADIVSDISTYSNYSSMRTSIRINYATLDHPSLASVYEDYFIGYDPTYNWWNMFKISSDGTKTYVSVTKLGNAISITPINSVGTPITIEINNSVTLQTDITGIIKGIDKILALANKFEIDLIDDFFVTSNYTGEPKTMINGKITATYDDVNNKFTFTLNS